MHLARRPGGALPLLPLRGEGGRRSRPDEGPRRQARRRPPPRKSPSGAGLRPHRPVAVKSRRMRSIRPPLRGCSAALRPLRGDCAVPMRLSASMIVAARSRPTGPACAATIMETESLGCAEGSRLARLSPSRTGVLANALWRANRETGFALTPSTDQAQRTGKISRTRRNAEPSARAGLGLPSPVRAKRAWRTLATERM